MLKQISILVLILIFSLCAFAQTEKYNAPVKWERYKVSDKDVSVLLPKLPVLVERFDVCSEEETKRFAAYADQTVYGFTITSKIKGKLPYLCSPQGKFDEKNFQDRVMQLKAELKEFTETDFNQNNLTVNKIAGKMATYWLINDFENKRWFELWVTNGNEEKPEVKNFVKSIEINKNAQGIEIGNGSNRTLGDEGVDDTAVVGTQEKNGNEMEKGEVESIKILLRPFPKYTDAARQASIHGTVSLRITFLASGGIGNISALSELPYGLTEQAIAVASKIVFIPAKRNGKNISTARIVEYSFSIY